VANKLVVVTGIKEVDRALKQFEPNLQKKVLRQALRKGGRILAIEVKGQAPVLTGATRRAVKVQAMKMGRRTSMGVKVVIAAGEKTAKTSARTGERFFVPAIEEFGDSTHAPNPFMRRAFNARAEQVRRVVIDAIRSGIEAIAGKK
jgi:HK97 gp10 family phage protein